MMQKVVLFMCAVGICPCNNNTLLELLVCACEDWLHQQLVMTGAFCIAGSQSVSDAAAC